MNFRISIFLVALLFPFLSVSALARSPFPNTIPLQPPPAYVQPNVSGNIQSSLTPSEQPAPTGNDTYTPNGVPTDATPDASAQALPSVDAGHGDTLWILTIVGVLLALGLFVMFKKRGND